MIRFDGHVHSSASSAPVTPMLSAIGPECHSPPERVYDMARRRGMDLVTLTDHDTMAGALELVERGFENVITGEEVTVHFPEDGCRLHVLVWGLTADEHEQIHTLGLRRDVYAFAAWLAERNLAHALAHPLYVQNGRLTREHIEKCALLFKGFEVLNGARSSNQRDAIEAFLNSLDAHRLLSWSHHYEIDALWQDPWIKSRTGGSDDHGLLNVGRSWTAISLERADPSLALAELRSGNARAGGNTGSASLMAHQWTAVLANRYAQTVHDKLGIRGQTIGSELGRFADLGLARPNRARYLINRYARKLRRRRSLPIGQAMRRTIQSGLTQHPDLAQRLGTPYVPLGSHAEMSAFVDDICDGVDRLLAHGARQAWRRRDFPEVLDHAASFALNHLAQLPDLLSLFHHNKDRAFVESFRDAGETEERPLRLSLFTDTLGDVNGVCRFIQAVGAHAEEDERDLQIITSTRLTCPTWSSVHNFPPTATLRLPGYENLELVLPPLMRILRHVDEHQPDMIHVSTPGPIGLVGLLAGVMLQVPVVGIYHTDFPAYVQHLFKDETLTRATSSAMRVFYRRLHTVFTRSECYGRDLATLGIEPTRIRSLRAGVDTECFHPRFRSRVNAERLGLDPEAINILYVGRVSVEKNLPFLVDVWRDARRAFRARSLDARLIVVGDGPWRSKMERAVRGLDATFLGFRLGEELATLYASGDLLLFPSTTDTLGQVIMEAAASGTPSIVSDQGGPQEVVRDGETGVILPVDREAWVKHLVDLASRPDDLRRMGAAARSLMTDHTLESMFEDFWTAHAEETSKFRVQSSNQR